MEIIEAVEIVLTLARESIDLDPCVSSSTKEPWVEACNTLEDFAVNHLGDD